MNRHLRVAFFVAIPGAGSACITEPGGRIAQGVVSASAALKRSLPYCIMA